MATYFGHNFRFPSLEKHRCHFSSPRLKCMKCDPRMTWQWWRWYMSMWFIFLGYRLSLVGETLGKLVISSRDPAELAIIPKQSKTSDFHLGCTDFQEASINLYVEVKYQIHKQKHFPLTEKNFINHQKFLLFLEVGAPKKGRTDTSNFKGIRIDL